MSHLRPRFGISLVCTVAGALAGFVASYFWGHDPERGNYLRRRLEDAIWTADHLVAGAIAGAILGIAFDFYLNGRPDRSAWRFTLKRFLFVVVALAAACSGIRSWLVIHNLTP